MNFKLAIMGFSLLTGVAFSSVGAPKKPPVKKKKATTTSKVKSGISLANMDKTTSPTKDFFQYVNGGWLKKVTIPPAESRWGSFNELRDKNRDILKKILEAAAKSSLNQTPKPGDANQLLGTFYASGMDSVTIEKLGAKPIMSTLNEIFDMGGARDIMPMTASLHMRGIFPLFGVYVDQDAKVSDQYALQFYQGGLGLPDKDYYLKTDERSKSIQEAYKKHIAAMFALVYPATADEEESERISYDAIANRIFTFEKMLAESSKSRVELRDPEANYNKMSIDELNSLVSDLGINDYFDALGLDMEEITTVIVGQPEFMKKVNAMVYSMDIADWKYYMQWNVIRGSARYLSSKFSTESFNFYGTVLSGTRALEQRWKRVMASSDNLLGDALGQAYVKTAFTPAAKKRMLELVNNLKLALAEHLNALDWMSPETKERGMQKLNTIVTKIGYPDKWKDYGSLTLKRDAYLANVVTMTKFEMNQMFKKLGKPIDRNEWGMTPPTINAYYNPTMNEIVFPAGILQAPFFDMSADDAVNYGAIGAVIGHELTHGFDDEGRKFDADGNLKEWWTEADAKAYEEKTAMIVKQFNDYRVLDSIPVNGELTLGENIADLGGVTIAYTAYKKSLKGKKAPVMDGFTGEQRFFIGYASVWRGKARDEITRQLIVTDPHSPAKHRVNGPLSNFPPFFEAFKVKVGDPMRRNELAKIW